MSTDKTVSSVLGQENAISPSEICGKEFRKSFRGYNADEVDHFMERLADAMEAMGNEVRSLRARNEELQARIEDFRSVEETLRSALVSTQKFGQDIVDSAKREAAAIVEEAKARKGQIELEAAKLPPQLSHDIRVLEQQRARLRGELMAILETHRNLLDSMLAETKGSAPVNFFDVGLGDSLTWDDGDACKPGTSEAPLGITPESSTVGAPSFLPNDEPVNTKTTRAISPFEEEENVP